MGTGDFGTAAPSLIRRLDDSERWMAVCEARADTDGDGKLAIQIGRHGDVSGDRMKAFLILGGGAGTPIDAFVDQSVDGRWLAVVRGTNLELVDSETGDVFALRDADIASDSRPGAPHRAAAFVGKRLLYTRHRDAGDALVAHDMADHAEREIAVGARVWRIDGGGSDRRVRVFTLPTGGAWPALSTSLAAGECIGSPMSYGTYGQTGPTPTVQWFDVEAGAEVVVQDALEAVGETMLRAPKSGGLYLDADEIAPVSCKPHVLAILPDPVRVIALCDVGEKRKTLLLGRNLRIELATVDRKDHYSDYHEALARASGVVCDAGLFCVTTSTNQRIDLKDGVATYAFGDRLYVVHATMSSRRQEIIDTRSGQRIPMTTNDRKMGAGRFILDYDDKLIDLEAAAVVGKATGALRINRAGRVLRTATKGQGPFGWSAP